MSDGRAGGAEGAAGGAEGAAGGADRAAGGAGGRGGLPDDSREDERWLVVNGRRWRRQDPGLPADVAARLLSHLGRGRSGVRTAGRTGQDPAPWRRRVDLAKHGLGERGTPWWEQDDRERHERWQAALQQLDERDVADQDPLDEGPTERGGRDPLR